MGFLSFLFKSILSIFLGRADLKRQGVDAAKIEQLKKENEILEKQNNDNITDVDSARGLFRNLRNKSDK